MPKWLVCFSVALLLIGFARPVSAKAPIGQIKVLSLNFNSENVPNDSNSLVRDLRFNALNRWISENEPDIVFIQEGWDYRGDPSIAVSVGRAMGYDVAYRLEMGLPGYLLDSDAVLTRKSLGMTGERDLKLPHSAPEIGNGKTWIIEFGKVSYAVGVKLALANGEPLYAYSTHLIASSASDRADQARAIDVDARMRAKADGLDWNKAHVIIGGDFNSAPGDPGPVLLAGLGYQDSFAAVHPGDMSCSDCASLSFPYFNPISIGAGLVPSQTGENTSMRGDYVFGRSPSFKALASTLMFTTPYDGVWMSDHYGVMTLFGDGTVLQPPNPVHDNADPIPEAEVMPISTDLFLCADPWNNNGNPAGPDCAVRLPEISVNGPRGAVFKNESDFYFEFVIDGPGKIFTSRTVALSPGEQASFSFDTRGTFSYNIQNTVQSPNPYRARLSGSIQVLETGYSPSE